MTRLARASGRRTFAELEGHFSFVAMHRKDPETLAGARRECPLVIGVGEGENFVASDVSAFLSETRRVQWIENGELVVIRPDGTRILTPEGEEVDRPVTEIDWDQETAEKEGYETFMLKEIHEQADAVADTIAGRLGEAGVELEDLGDISDEFLRDMRRAGTWEDEGSGESGLGVGGIRTIKCDLLDPNAPASETNEIWPTLSANAGGQAFASVRTEASIRLDAQSIVIHDAVTRLKIACADLR